MAPRLRALLAGFYGAANLGDEMILSVILDWLGQANAEAVVVSLNPAYTRVEFGVEAVSFDSLAEIAAVAATSDVFVLGGGGLFQDHHRFDVPSLYRFPAGTVSQYAQLLFLAAQHGLPTVALAQGVGPLRSIPVRDIVAEVFTRATRVSLRDAASAEILRAIGVDRDVIIAPDPGWCYEARPGQKTLAERFPELRERRTFIVVLREWDFVGGWEEPLSRALRQGLGAGDAIVWACFQRNAGDDVAVLTDDATIERVMAAAGNDVAHARWLDATLDEIVQAIAECAGVIAMRLHALLIAIRCGKPVIALEYDDKMRHLGDTAGLSDVMRVPLDRIADAMPRALRALTAGSNSVPRAAVERLIRDAGEHRDLLFDALKNVGPRSDRTRWRSTGFDWIGSWRDGDVAPRERAVRRLTAQLAQTAGERDEIRTALSHALTNNLALTSANAEQKTVNSELTSAKDELAKANDELSTTVEKLKGALNTQAYATLCAEERYKGAIESRSWRLTRPLRMAGDVARGVGKLGARVVQSAREEGLRGVARKTIRKVRLAKSHHADVDRTVAEYLSIVARYADRRIVVFRPVVDWDLPLFQRPQQIARELARQGFLYFYCTPNLGRDAVFGFREIAPGLVLTDQYLLLLDHLPNKIWHLYSTDLTCDVAFAEARMANGDSLLYEYIDELHADISGQIPASALMRHHAFLADERIPLVTSADKLATEARKVRRRNHLLATNGVEIEHFATKRGDFPVPAEIEAVVTRGKPIIGYFGALAKWFDYALVIALARARPDLEVLLIGWDYDGSMKAHDWTSVPNVSIVGPIRYELLPRFACWFDVATIPFLLNDITESTSPIKLFEYMAMDCPIVTTDLPECRKYASTLIGRDHRQFIERVDEALARRGDPAYHATLANEAARNSWAGKAREIGALVRIDRTCACPILDDIEDAISAYYREDDAHTVPQYERGGYRREERYYWYPVLNWIDRLDSVNSIIDVGGAYGTLLLYAKRRHKARRIVLIDPVRYASPSMVRKEGIDYIVRDFEREVELVAGTFDLVIFTETIEHLNFHPLPTLDRLRERVAPGGHLVLSTPDAEEWGRVTQYYSALSAIPPYTGQQAKWIDGHIWQYRKGELDAVLEQAGFETIDFAFAPGVSGRHLCYLLRPL